MSEEIAAVRHQSYCYFNSLPSSRSKFFLYFLAPLATFLSFLLPAPPFSVMYT
ncbi:hypothetical protein BC828DRAFT_356150 [Blastocladiella britannica]|nr:hypothetical protein BC828DRAFT_356150 [Blastocladiella britannica]